MLHPVIHEILEKQQYLVREFCDTYSWEQNPREQLATFFFAHTRMREITPERFGTGPNRNRPVRGQKQFPLIEEDCRRSECFFFIYPAKNDRGLTAAANALKQKTLYFLFGVIQKDSE